MYRVCDMHCDTITELKRNGQTLRKNKGHIDIEKLQAGHYLVQCFAMFVFLKAGEPYKLCNEYIDFFEQQIQANPGTIKQIYCSDDIDKHKINALLTIEEGGVLEGNIDNLLRLYRRGVRMMTLTWNFPNELGRPNFLMQEKWKDVDFTRPNTTDGLTAFGIEVVKKMNEYGMIVDVSHLSDAGFWDVVKYCKGPFVASHSNSRAEHGVVRNLTDAMIIAVADAEGVIGINYCPDFVSNSKENQIPDLVRHIQHIVAVGGIDVCALGSDFDGIETPKGMSDASKMDLLYKALKDAGFSDGDIDKIFYKNFLRVFEAVCG